MHPRNLSISDAYSPLARWHGRSDNKGTEAPEPPTCAHRSFSTRRAGFHSLRRGYNRKWELAGLNPAVQRQMMGHTSAAMTELYTGKIPLEQVRAAFSSKSGNEIVVLENMENEAVEQVL